MGKLRQEIRSRAQAGPWGWLVTRHATHTVMAVRRACLTLLHVVQRCMVLETVREHVLEQLHAMYSLFGKGSLMF